MRLRLGRQLTGAETFPAESRESLDVVHRNSLRLLKLVNTLLDFSRIEAGRIEAVNELTDLGLLDEDGYPQIRKIRANPRSL